MASSRFAGSPNDMPMFACRLSPSDVLSDGEALVPGREHHDHALTPQPAQLDAQRRVAAVERLDVELAAEAQVHAVDHDLAGSLVGLEDVVERLDDPRVLARAVVVEHLVDHELGVGAMPHITRALPCASVVRVRAGDDAGDVRAVAEPVVRRARAGRRGKIERREPSAAPALRRVRAIEDPKIVLAAEMRMRRGECRSRAPPT